MEKILACVLAIALLLTMSSCRPNEESATEKTTLIPAAVEEDAEETSGEQEEAAERSDPDKAGETAMSETPVEPSVPGDQGLTEQSETAVPEEQQNEEEVQQASFTQQHFTLRNGRVIGYWLYTPAGAVENMPLILYLHGGSGKGDDLELVTQADSLPQYLQNGQLAPEAYVLIPQLPAACRGWEDVQEALMQLVSAVQESCQTDPERVSLTGHSMGGTGVWQLALRYPDSFCAIAPLSGSVQASAENVSKLRSLPVWAVVGSEDAVVDPFLSVQMVEALSEQNAQAYTTVIEGADHFAVPEEAYLSGRFDIIGWLTGGASLPQEDFLH